MEKTTDEVALLVAQSGPLNGQRWALRDTILVGRDELCDIVIPDRQVSRRHARFMNTPKGVIVEDLNSKNGTHLNGKQVSETFILQDGDLVQIALAQKFVFLSSDATLPLGPDFINLQAEAANGKAPRARPGFGEPDTLESLQRLRLDKRSHRVWIRFAGVSASKHKSKLHEVEIDPPLSASQFRMLEMLYDQQGKVVSRQDLVAGVWGAEEAIGVSEQALDALIRRLRDRLASIDPGHTFIITVRGHGLRLDNPSVKD